mmetsp:Transcript_7723/g.11636  ORF Transcript_7723/g.11636 Transcript_7723/m.11636 type:complete len:261 (+) Transcript_7723:70-852(+)
MPKGKSSKLKAVSKASKAASGSGNPLMPSKPKNLRVGGDVQPTKDVSRFVRWPRYVRVQRQKKVLLSRLKVPGTLNEFRHPLDRAEAVPFFKLMAKYSPETKEAKAERLEGQAAAAAGGGTGAATSAPVVLKYGINHVTHLVEQQKAKLVVIACDVAPIEIVVWLPMLCRTMDVPYVIVNNKGRLGSLVNMKKAAAVALTDVKGEDQGALLKLAEAAKARFNDNVEIRKRGGGIMGMKTQVKLAKRAAMLAAEEAKKKMY